MLNTLLSNAILQCNIFAYFETDHSINHNHTVPNTTTENYLIRTIQATKCQEQAVCLLSVSPTTAPIIHWSYFHFGKLAQLWNEFTAKLVHLCYSPRALDWAYTSDTIYYEQFKTNCCELWDRRDLDDPNLFMFWRDKVVPLNYVTFIITEKFTTVWQ